MRTVFYSFLLIAIVLLGMVLLGVYWTFYRSAPDYDASVRSEYLLNEADVTRDQHGVPHISADTEQDAYFAMGYVHAQDRLWQLSVQQLMIQGRFSEFFGEQTVDLDMFSRFLNLDRIGQQLLEELSSEELQLLEAYTHGINQFIDRGSRAYPIEFSLTSVTPLEWEPHHVLAMFKLKEWNQSTSEANLVSLLISQNVPSHIWQELFPDALVPPEESITQFNKQPVLELIRASRDAQRTLGWEPSPSGSNAWIVGGQHTSSGYPVVAADPHSSLTIPSPWYEMVLHVNNESVGGFTMPGIPAFLIGRNNNVSWAITNTMTADTEFISFPEREFSFDHLTPAFEDDSRINVRREIIRLKNGSERLVLLQSTSKGPVINRIFDESISDDPVVMNWHGLHSGQDFSGWRNLKFADSGRDVESSANLMNSAPLHLLYADRTGSTGHLITGHIEENNYPPGIRPASDSRRPINRDTVTLHTPDEYFSETEGLLINANNAFTISEGYQPGYFFEPAGRAERIEYLLMQSVGSHTVEESRELQHDLTSHYAAEIGSVILPILEEYETDPKIEQILQYLQNWEYNYTSNSTAATVFEYFLIEFGKHVFGRVLDDDLLEAYFNYDFFSYKAIHHILMNGSQLLDPTFEDENFPAEPAVVESMRSAVDRLNEEISPQPFEWGWGYAHQFSFSPFIRSSIDSKFNIGASYSLVEQNLLLRGPYAHGGHSTTINQGKYNWNDPFTMFHGASARFITDLEENTYSAVLSTGQSGNPLSSYYDDQIPMWREGNYRTVRPGAEPGEFTYHTLKLLPE